MKMNPDVLGHLESALLNSGRMGVAVQNRLPIVIDDVYFSGEVKLVQDVVPRFEPAAAKGANGPAPAGERGGAGPPPAVPPVPGAIAGAPGVIPPVAHPPGQPAARAPAGPAEVPHLVQVPRGKVVELLATAYFVDMGQVEALKVALNDRGRL
jgi:hypothetical protein